MKPTLNQKVYILEYATYFRGIASDFYIIPERAAFLGERSFIVEYPQDKVPCEWFYKDFGKEWFDSLVAAKEYAEKVVKKKIKWYRWSNGMYSTLPEE